ncbi:hypothetical protein K0M31_008802 [Melipona bicolor]|uniref:Uncharacterized protein n=1 Tax=Melipona bicolor TaxID=60889 RepID=A0AA40FPV3_9HYME|nr:hypothetical protein K0M31_008802 [Melipona bicolor]
MYDSAASKRTLIHIMITEFLNFSKEKFSTGTRALLAHWFTSTAMQTSIANYKSLGKSFQKYLNKLHSVRVQGTSEF